MSIKKKGVGGLGWTHQSSSPRVKVGQQGRQRPLLRVCAELGPRQRHEAGEKGGEVWEFRTRLSRIYVAQNNGKDLIERNRVLAAPLILLVAAS